MLEIASLGRGRLAAPSAQDYRADVRRFVPSFVLLLLTACPDAAPPPAPSVSVAPQSASSAPSAASSVPAADAGPSDANADSALGSNDGDAAVVAVPDLFAPDGAVLGQTDAFPSLDSTSYKARLELLWRAIVADDPDLGAPCFFPLEAYQQVKAIPNPAADWKSRLLGAFDRDVHKYHGQLGDHPEHAKLLGLDVPVDKAKWMNPGEEGNKLGYDRVLHSTLRYQRADGKEAKFDVVSMISWRGEWYVVHLGGFK